MVWTGEGSKDAEKNGWIYSTSPNMLSTEFFSYQVKSIVVTFSLKDNHSPCLYSFHTSALLEQMRSS